MIFLLLILSLFVADVAEATIFWASPTGNGATCGTTGTSDPLSGYTTVAKAATCMTGGDTLMMKNGNYDMKIGPGFIEFPSGTVSNPTIIKAETAKAAIIAPTSVISGGLILWVNARDYITFDGIKVSGENTFSGTSNIIQIGTSGGAVNTGIIFKNGECTRSRTTSCMSVAGTNHQILNNEIHDNGPNDPAVDVGTHGIYVTTPSSGTIIDGNLIYNQLAAPGGSSLGIQLFHDGINNVIVRRNTVHHVPATGIYLSGGTGNVAYNNVIYNAGIGIVGASFGGSSSTNITFYNNTIYNSSICGQQQGSPAGTNTYKNNFCLSNTTNTIALNPANGGGNFTTSNNVSSTTVTLVVNAASGDFTPAPGSSLIDAGTSSITGTITITACGTPPGCYFGAAPDIGAVESGGTPASVAWTSNRGGAPNSLGMTGPNSGSASLIGSNWTISSIPLSAGLNNITVTYTDTIGVQTTDNLAVTYAPTFPGNTLASAWSFDNVATDSSGNANNATLINGAGYNSNGRFGAAALSLNGVNQYALVNDSNSLDFTQSYTFSAWVFPTSIPSTTWAPVITKNYNAGLYAASTYCGAGTPLAYLRVNGQAGPDYYACSTQPLTPNQWTHLAGTYDGSNLRLYINGALATVTSATGYIEPSALSMQIGATGYGTEFFPGRIDEARTYNWGLPLSTLSNTTPGASCTQQNYADNASNPSIIGNMNCGIVAVTTPVTIKFPASATSLKVGAAPGAVKFGQAGQ